jgi:hypothetical protein
MLTTEIHHQKDGVLVLWAHACGHHSNSIHYESAAEAEKHREGMEAVPCWACRTLAGEQEGGQ